MLKAKTIAWLVHLYTASGAVFGMLALLAAASGDPRRAFLFLCVAALIDGTDGILARRVKVSEILPNFSGAYLDNAVDVLTYIFVPLFIIVWEGLLPAWWWIIPPTLAAMYAYGQVNMKTEDHYFLGFPSYWNIVALYMWWFQASGAVAVAMVLVPTVLTFIPTRWLYPSRNSLFWRTSWTLGGIWTAILFYILWTDTRNLTLISFSLYYPVYYALASFYVEFKIRREAREAAESV